MSGCRGERRTANIDFYLLFGLVTYFIWCDLNFFGQLSSETEETFRSNATTSITKYTVKYRLLAHFSHYIYQPFCIWLEDVFTLSQVPGVSPNLITFIHFTIAVICGKLFASNDLYWRRVAVLLFCTRTMLDNLDGVIFRAQKKSNTKDLVSGWGTMGFWIDGLADTFGSLFIMIGSVHWFFTNPPIKNSGAVMKVKVKDEDKDIEKDFLKSDDKAPKEHFTEYHSKSHVLFIALCVTICCVMRSLTWDHFNETFHKLLGAKRPDANPEKQFEALNYTSTCFTLWLWTFNSGDAFLNYTLIAIYFNKLWKWMKFSTYAAIPTISIVCLISQVHLVNMRNELGVTVFP